MKTIRLLLLTLFALLGTSAYASDSICDYYVPACKEKFKRYNDGAAAITQAVADKKLTQAEGGKRVADLARSLYPNDPLILAITAQQQAMAEIFSKSTMTTQQQKVLEEAASKTFNRALQERFTLFDTMAEMEQGQQRMAAQQAQAQQVAVEQAQNVRATVATSYFLNRVGQAFATSYGQSLLPTPQICTYYGGTSYCQ